MHTEHSGVGARQRAGTLERIRVVKYLEVSSPRLGTSWHRVPVTKIYTFLFFDSDAFPGTAAKYDQVFGATGFFLQPLARAGMLKCEHTKKNRGYN